MTIIAKSSFGVQILGYIGYDLSAYIVGQTFQLNCLFDICTEDLFPILEPTDKANWTVNWKLIFKSGTNFLNTGRFQGAIPKFDLGSWGFTSLGILSFQDFFNYQSQVSPTFVSFSNSGYENYPQSWNPPYVPSGTPLEINTFSGYGVTTKIADTAFVQISGSTIEGAGITAYYNAIWSDSSYNQVYAYF